MNGKWANKLLRAALVPATIVLVSAMGGCQRYDGALNPACSRLTISNETPWSCEVRVEAQATKGRPDFVEEITTILLPGERYTWDMLAGKYKLYAMKLEPPFMGYSKEYEASPGSSFIWPLKAANKDWQKSGK